MKRWYWRWRERRRLMRTRMQWGEQIEGMLTKATRLELLVPDMEKAVTTEVILANSRVYTIRLEPGPLFTDKLAPVKPQGKEEG
jgi:hypothetical protein